MPHTEWRPLSNPPSQQNLTFYLQELDALLNNALGGTSSGREFGPFQWAGSVGEYVERALIGTSPVTLTLPTSPVLNIVIVNWSPTATLTVIGTPNGGSSATLAVLQPAASGLPGGLFLRWETSTSGSAGYTALSLQASAASTPVEYFLGG